MSRAAARARKGAGTAGRRPRGAWGRAAAMVLLLAATAVGCATKSDVQSLEQQLIGEMRRLQAEQEALMQRMGLAFDSLSQQGQRDILSRGELQRRFDELSEMLAQVVDMVIQNNRLLSELRQGGGIAGGAGGPAGGAAAGTGGASDEPTLFYRAALEQYNRGAYGTARGGFEDFLENYPDHELAPDAQFWIAETYAGEGEMRRALEEYEKVWTGWSDSERAASALYKAGVIEMERGNLPDARSYFQRVTLGYPESPEATLAEDQLRRIRR